MDLIVWATLVIDATASFFAARIWETAHSRDRTTRSIDAKFFRRATYAISINATLAILPVALAVLHAARRRLALPSAAHLSLGAASKATHHVVLRTAYLVFAIVRFVAANLSAALLVFFANIYTISIGADPTWKTRWSYIRVAAWLVGAFSIAAVEATCPIPIAEPSLIALFARSAVLSPCAARRLLALASAAQLVFAALADAVAVRANLTFAEVAVGVVLAARFLARALAANGVSQTQVSTVFAAGRESAAALAFFAFFA